MAVRPESCKVENLKERSSRLEDEDSGEDDDNESIEIDEDYEELTTAKPLPNPTKQPAFAVPPSPNNRNYIYFTYGKYVVSLLALCLPEDNSAILAQLVMNRTSNV